MASVRLNTGQITDWESFHEVCKAEMGFPDFYGMNLDAWIDCLSYLDEDAGMTRFRLVENEMLQIEITDTEDFKSRLPEIFDALVECAAFVNQRYIENGKTPPISIVFL
jgi:RNAse (barnase) inhibitor barstar